MSNPFNLNPVRVENFFAYPKGHPHHGKIRVLLNYNPFKEGEEVDIDTDKIKIRGKIEAILEKRIIIVKMNQLVTKEAVN
jgi:hypothetical protein